MTSAEQPGRTQALTGVVASKSGSNTISVVIGRLVKHPTYGKFLRRRTRLAVHDPSNAAGVGDLVEIVPCRRISKTKSWRLVKVVRKAVEAVETAAQEGS
jgi:small subunit ribosomal protein S17